MIDWHLWNLRFALAISVILLIGVLALTDRIIPDILVVVVSSLIGFFLGHTNGYLWRPRRTGTSGLHPYLDTWRNTVAQELFPDEWFSPLYLNVVTSFLRHQPIQPEDKKRIFQEWAELSNVHITGSMIEAVTGLPASEV